jgi:rhodanese-related sulfurtransferase
MRLKLLVFLGIFIGQDYKIVASDQLGVELPYVSIDIVYSYKDNVEGKENPRWYLINVLPDDVCGECFIPGSINIPTHKLQKKLSNSKKWPRDRKIILYCAGGGCPLSKYAYEIVTNLGFKDVQILEGGIVEWIKNKLPIEGACLFEYLKA